MTVIQTSQREKILIITAGVVLFVVVSFFIWKPVFRAWRLNSNLQVSKRSELELTKQTLAKEKEWSVAYEELLKTIGSKSGPQAVVDALQKVEQLASGAGVTVRTRNSGETKMRGGFTEVPVECSVEATTDAMVKFLYDIKVAQDLLDVAELKVTPTPANPSVLRCDLRIVALRSGTK